MSELPASWSIQPLGELNQFSSSTVDPSTRPDHLFELYSVPSFPAGKPEKVPGSAIGSTKQTVAPGDVLISKINPRINRVWTVGTTGTYQKIASSEWIGFRSEAVQPAFANYYFKSPGFRDLLCSEVAGVGGSLTRAQPRRVAAYSVPVAPLAEQTRIADQLDVLLARIKACNDHLDAIPGLIKRFRRAVINAGTTGALTEEWLSKAGAPSESTAQAGIPNTNVAAIALDLRYGTSKKCDYSPAGVLVLRIPNIADHGRIDLSDLKSAEFDSNELAKLSLQEGDLLVIRSNGSLDLVGKTSVVTKAEVGLLFAGYLMRLRVDTRLAVPEFIQLCLSASGQRRYIEQTAKSTSGVNNLNAEELRALKLWLPDLAEQREVVRRVGALFQFAAGIEASFSTMSGRTRRLAPQVLAKAFRGELLPQDPDDEPASDLLARIAGRGAIAASKAPQAIER